jgi:hypothetical protein
MGVLLTDVRIFFYLEDVGFPLNACLSSCKFESIIRTISSFPYNPCALYWIKHVMMCQPATTFVV